MKLEDIFFKSFFFPFLIGVFLSTLIVTILLGFFTNDSYDTRTIQKIIDLEKKNSELNIKSANIKVTSKILKYQLSLNQLIVHYQKIANDLLIDENSHQFQTDYLLSALSVDYTLCFWYTNYTEHLAVWILDSYSTNEYVEYTNIYAKKELTAFSNIIENLDAIYQISKDETFSFFFYFDQTELYISFPLYFQCMTYNVFNLGNFPYYVIRKCMDDRGQFYSSYKMKCDDYFQNMMKSKTKKFDNNYLSNQNKTIFLNNFFFTILADADQEFALCIEFEDPITNGKAYACCDTFYNDLVGPLDNLNENMKGYFFISNIGFNNVFYFPHSTSTGKIPTEYIFNLNTTFKLDEKTDFYYYIKKKFSSNYIDYIGESVYDEVFVNGKNSSGQEFDIDGEKFHYSIYPVVFKNLNGKKEHLFSIIYIYNDRILLGGLSNIYTSLTIKILVEVLIFFIFGFGLLYIIYLTFNTISKNIVIPIKNVTYMLKGINIGGENRIQFLDHPKKLQNECLEKLEKMYSLENKKKNQENKGLNNDINNAENDSQEKESLKDTFDENVDYNKIYDEKSDYLEKEFSFYNFDDELLRYRPLEIERLVKSLFNLKEALILTSEDREVKQIIDYSFSEKIFKNFKNKEGSIICQSNIGNLQGQLKKYDKAIYHLALSLLDNKLKRFLNKNISDELDEGDILLTQISNYFNDIKNKEKTNALVIKQINSSNDTFSQKIIGILIYTRYCRLVHFYYIFFKNLQKLEKSGNNNIKGQFMNTSFHTINYYHKIIIQYIFLSYTKNDLIKIGESILDYLEFLIKFKFKTTLKDKHFLKMDLQDNPEYIEKQNFKKKIFDKILSWFNLFEDYIFHVRNSSSLGDMKSFLEDYSKSLDSDNSEFNLESNSSLMFRVNIQKYDFLKGKFCLACENYNDALFYFIRAAKKNSIVIDGLTKKRSLKHIYKLILKVKTKLNEFKLKNLYLEKEMKIYCKEKNKIYNQKFKMTKKITNRSSSVINKVTFGDEIEKIKDKILIDIGKCNSKQEKDIIIIIDFNIYSNNQEENLYNKTYKIDTFIEQTQIILNTYLSNNDRLCVLIYTNEYKIICPLMNVSEIDINGFSLDLINYKNITFEENIETDEYDFDLNEIREGDDIGFNIGDNENLEDYIVESVDLSEETEKYYDKISVIVESINYIYHYLKKKEKVKNEKYIILFTDIINLNFTDDYQIEKNMKNLIRDKEVIFLLVGKIKDINLKNDKNIVEENDKKLEKFFLSKFGEKSEIIYFENMKKIKTILSNNNVIKDEIIYPNEIYK